MSSLPNTSSFWDLKFSVQSIFSVVADLAYRRAENIAKTHKNK